MEKPRATDDIVDVLRSRRVELVDSRNRVRAVLGASDNAPHSASTGLWLYDVHGSQRSALIVEPDGVLLSFAVGGNVVAELGGRDIAEANAFPGAYLVLCDGDGAPVIRWMVAPDGRVDAVWP